MDQQTKDIAELTNRLAPRPTHDAREQMRADGIICTLCLYLGLAHDGDHSIPLEDRHGPGHDCVECQR